MAVTPEAQPRMRHGSEKPTALFLKHSNGNANFFAKEHAQWMAPMEGKRRSAS